jgi:uncharacterized membrane protein
MAEYIDRKRVKAEARGLLKAARVSSKRFFALYLGLIALLDLASTLAIGDTDVTALFSNPLGLFVIILTNLLSLILGVGVYLYCFGVRRGERMEYLTLFDGFSFAGKVLLLYIVEYFFIFLWMLLLIVPGFIALYRYRFAVLNLCENPSLGVLEAIEMSKRQTYGYKGQLFTLDLSYLGWGLLANSATIYFRIAYNMNAGFSLPEAAIPLWAEILIEDAVMLLVGIFYLPVYQTTELGYFEISKRSSGTGFGMLPEDPGPDAPDGGDGTF